MVRKGRFCSAFRRSGAFPGGVSMQKMSCKITRWMVMQHFPLWRGPCITQRQARESISSPELAKRARLLSFNTAQSRAVIGLLTGHNTLGKHLHILGSSDNPNCRNCTEEETSAHILAIVRPWPYSGTHTWVPSPWTQRMSQN